MSSFFPKNVEEEEEKKEEENEEDPEEIILEHQLLTTYNFEIIDRNKQNFSGKNKKLLIEENLTSLDFHYEISNS